MNVRSFALVYGLVFLALGAIGFIPALVTPHEALEQELLIHQGAGDLLGLFPTNVLHNVGHAAVGVWGLLASRSPRASLLYARIVALGLVVVVIMGFIPRVDTLFGLVPLHGGYIWLHALLAPAAGYFALAHRVGPEQAAGPVAPES